MLKSLELAGFKSFAKKSLLEFKTPISAIVGPNGSGKSNVAEAFRFVLGEQSIKSMRGKRGEDLIFNGSPTAPRSNRASVKLVFDNKDRLLNIDFDEVVIERVVHRDSTNEYLLNGSQVRLRDIVELLGGAHIGSSGHHIISQGEADRILNVSSKERKAMIEDALGLKIYQYKKEESQRKLLKTEENIKTVEGLRREIAPHLRFLKKQVEKIEKAILLKEELITLAKEYFKRESFYIKYEKARIDGEKKKPEEEYSALEKELQMAKSIINSQEENGTRFGNVEILEKKLDETRENISGLLRELGRIEGEHSVAKRNLDRQKEELLNAESLNIEFAKLQTLRKEIDFFIEESEAEEDVLKLKQIITRIKKTISDFFDEHRKSKNDVDELIKTDLEEIKALEQKKKETQGAIEVGKAEEEKTGRELSELRSKIEAEKSSYKDAEKEVYRIMARQNDLKSVLNSLRADLEKVSLESDEFEREMAEVSAIVGPEALRYDNLKLEDGDTVREDRKEQAERKREVEKLKIRLEDQGISGSADIMKEYNETKERDEFLETELLDLGNSANSLKELIKELEERLSNEFKTGIDKINEEFKNFFSLMFGGGNAGISLSVQKKKKRRDTDIEIDEEMMEEEGEEEIEEGIDINVSLPHKKIKGLMMLSGGERALTSIALLFAVSQVNPPPFVILDETDAALDEANSRRYGDMVRMLAKHSQLILITHNRETMNAAGVLYGITMGADGVSKLLSVNFDEATGFAK